MMTQAEALMTATEVAELLRVSRSTVTRLVNRGELECVRFGGSVRFRSNAVAALIASLARAPGQPEDASGRGTQIKSEVGART